MFVCVCVCLCVFVCLELIVAEAISSYKKLGLYGTDLLCTCIFSDSFLCVDMFF